MGGVAKEVPAIMEAPSLWFETITFVSMKQPRVFWGGVLFCLIDGGARASCV